MKKKFLPFAVAASLLVAGTWLVSCDDDDNNGNKNGNAVITIQNVSTEKDFNQSGTFSGTNGGNIAPGETVSFTFYAGKEQALMFATKYSYSNDLFFAPENPGLALFDSDGKAITGDVSDKIKLWDNGTRLNEAPGVGITLPGTAEAGNITQVPGLDPQENQYPAASDMMKVNLAYNTANSQFTITIRNASASTTRETPFSPGVWAISNKIGDDLVNTTPFFTAGQKSGTELTALAETGDPASLYAKVQANTGIVTELSHAIVVVYSGTTNPIYTLNQNDAGYGLKEFSQTNDAKKLKESLEKMSNVDQVYIIGNKNQYAPGENFEGSFIARNGYNITFATRFVASNDWFYSTNSVIDSQTTGDITGRVSLLDSGTGVNQYPGAGNSQNFFGGTSQVESNPITTVGTTYPVPSVANIIKVTLR